MFHSTKPYIGYHFHQACVFPQIIPYKLVNLRQDKVFHSNNTLHNINFTT